VLATNFGLVLIKTSATIEGKCELWANYFAKPIYVGMFSSQEFAQPKLKESNQFFMNNFHYYHHFHLNILKK
jgi:hypothetical protein